MREHSYITGQKAEQGAYLPECLDEIITEENPIRFIRLFVDQLDLEKMGFERSQPKKTGRPGYDPAIMLKLYMGTLIESAHYECWSESAIGTSNCGG